MALRLRRGYFSSLLGHLVGQPLVTQWELVASVEHISEAYLLPVIVKQAKVVTFAWVKV